MASSTENQEAAAAAASVAAAHEQQQQQQLKKRVRHRSIVDGKSMYFGKYVSQEGSEKLLTYQYHGSDNSLIYKHVLTPMNDFLVNFLPLWLAPNLITLIGLILVGCSHLLFAIYCPFLDGDAPAWLFVVAAVTLFAYQTLDNLDGKQARRTGSSSPLGLLFDHGCDALNVSVGTMTMACVLQLGATWKTLSFAWSAHVVFICATWEEYYSGSLQLPLINGPTEGILIGISLKLFTAIVGPQFWTQEILPGFQNNTVFVIVTAISSCLTIAVKYVSHSFAFRFSNIWDTNPNVLRATAFWDYSVVNVLHAVRLRKDSIIVALTRLAPFCILNVLGVLWATFSPSDIFAQYPRTFLWMLGLLNSKLVLHLMLAHLCGEEYHPFRKTLVPIFYVAAHCGFSMLEGIYDAINEGLIVKEFFFLSLVSYIHIVITVVWEVKNVLDIGVFTIKNPKPKAS